MDSEDKLRNKLEELIKAAKAMRALPPKFMASPWHAPDNRPHPAEKKMPENPQRPKATMKPMGANAKPVLAHRHGTKSPESTDAGKPTIKDRHLMEEHKVHEPEKTKKAEMCKFDKNGQWYLDKADKY